MEWTVLDGVYEPREDSHLMVSVLEQQDFSGKSVLDIGTGSGILAYTALDQGADHVTAVDVNPVAVENTWQNLDMHGIDEGNVSVIESDLFTAVDDRFDVILCNPPYVPGEEELGTMEEQSWQGGDQGRDVIDRFLEVFTAYISRNGEVYLLQSSRNDIDRTLNRFDDQGCDATVVAEKKVPWERLVVIRAVSR